MTMHTVLQLLNIQADGLLCTVVHMLQFQQPNGVFLLKHFIIIIITISSTHFPSLKHQSEVPPHLYTFPAVVVVAVAATTAASAEKLQWY